MFRAEDSRQARPAPWRGILLVLLALSAVLTVLSFVLPYSSDHPIVAEGTGSLYFLLDVVLDFNLPTWWSASLLVIAAAGHLVAAWVALPRSRATAAAWVGLGLLTALMSLDDTIRIHERLDRLTNRVLDPSDYPFTWVLLGIPIAIGILVAAVVLGRALPRRTRNAILVGLGTFFFAAVGIEVLGGWLLHTTGVSTIYRISYHIEEFLEMAGAAVLVVAPLIGVQTSPERDVWTLPAAQTQALGAENSSPRR